MQEKVLSPKIDYAFKLLFGNEKNIHLLKYLLKVILEFKEDELETIELLSNENTKESEQEKTTVLDVVAKLKDGKRINIEIQIINTKDLAQRFLFYWANLYKRQLEKGKSYGTLKKCISINIVDFEIVPLEMMHTIYQVLETRTYYRLTDMLEMHIIELPKLKDYSKEEREEFIQLMQFINSNTKEEMKMLAKNKKELEDILEVMERITDDDKLWYEYESREKIIRDEISKREYFEKLEKKVLEKQKQIEESQKEFEESQKEFEESQKELEKNKSEFEELKKQLDFQNKHLKEKELKIKQKELKIKNTQNKIINKMLEDGFSKKIIEKYFGNEI